MQTNKIKKKTIEQFVQDISDFEQAEKEKWNLEQHLTPPSIAADILNTIYLREQNLENKIVADFGVGTGMLLAGALFIGFQFGYGLDIDEKYIQIAQENLMEKFDGNDLFELININVKNWKYPQKEQIFDIVIMNPPFGTKQEGIDMVFLLKAFETCSGNIYSLHKSSTRDFLMKKAKEFGRTFQLISEINFPLPKRFNKYHKKDLGFTQVDFICFEKNK